MICGSSCENETRYGPAKCLGCIPQAVSGASDTKHVRTSYVERQNLTVRMSMKRFALLTNDCSNNWENHAAMVSLYFMYYNFSRVDQTLRVTPAMEAGIADRVWSIEEIVALLRGIREDSGARPAAPPAGRGFPTNDRERNSVHESSH